MTFAELHETQRQLSLRLRVHAGERAFDEITVSLPTKDNDELSFLRLVVWCYVTLHEAGRVALRFLKELPPIQKGELRPEVGYLRTWATHNLMPDRASDQKRLRLAWGWFRVACGTSTPTTEPDWQACFLRLSEDMNQSLRDALAASEALVDPGDGPPLIDELRKRLDRNWEAFRFDAVVAAAATRLGFDGIDPVAFRQRHVESWRRVVASAEEQSIGRLLEQRVEKDLLDLMNDALPIPTRDIVDRIATSEPKELGLLMLALRSRSLTSRHSVGKFIEELSESGPELRAAPIPVASQTRTAD